MLYLVDTFFLIGVYEFQRINPIKAKTLIEEAMEKNAFVNSLSWDGEYYFNKVLPMKLPPSQEFTSVGDEYLIFIVLDKRQMMKYPLIAKFLTSDPFVFLYAKRINKKEVSHDRKSFTTN